MRSAANAFAEAPRSSSTPAGTPTVLVSGSSAISCQRPAGTKRTRCQCTVAKLDARERPVVAGVADRPADRRIDEPGCHPGRLEGCLECIPEQRAHAVAAAPVQQLELGVWSESAAGEIERAQLAQQDRACGEQRVRIRQSRRRPSFRARAR